MTSKRIVTGARYGLRDWLAQRVTAAIMAVRSIVSTVCATVDKTTGKLDAIPIPERIRAKITASQTTSS